MAMTRAYDQAKKLYKEHIKDGWVPEAAWNDCVCSYALTIKDSAKLRKYAKLPK